MRYYIYKVTNKSNGKSYVGQHKVNPEEKFMRYLGKGFAIREAIRQYGRDNFTKEILEELEDDESRELVNERERYWIAKLNTMDPNGYNLYPGGKNGCTKEMAEKIIAKRRANGTLNPSEETKQKMSEAAKGRRFSEEHKKHLSEHHHRKTEHIILFEDGHIEKTTDSLVKIAKQHGISQNTLIRFSAEKRFIDGIMLQGIEPGQYACLKQGSPKLEKLCEDPIKHDICKYKTLWRRAYKHPDRYVDIDVNQCIIEEENNQ